MVNHGRRNAAVFAASAATLGVLFLFPTSLHPGAAAQVAQAPLTPGAVAEDVVAQGTSSTGSTATGTAASSTATGSTATGTAATGTSTVTGTAASTRFGPVQVQIVVRDGQIVTATALTYPQNNGRDRQINAYAVPILQAETLDAQGAGIDTVSGATYTSTGYRQSLQAALDAAHLS